MNLTKLAGVLLAVFVVATGAAAALPGDAPTDSHAEQAGNHTDAPDHAGADDPVDETPDAAENETADDEMSETPDEASAPEAANGTADEARQGPPTDMPEQVPDFVTQIHDLIQQKLDGTVSDLGAQISDLTPGDDETAGESDAGGASNAPVDVGPGR